MPVTLYSYPLPELSFVSPRYMTWQPCSTYELQVSLRCEAKSHQFSCSRWTGTISVFSHAFSALAFLGVEKVVEAALKTMCGVQRESLLPEGEEAWRRYLEAFGDRFKFIGEPGDPQDIATGPEPDYEAERDQAYQYPESGVLCLGRLQ